MSICGRGKPRGRTLGEGATRHEEGAEQKWHQGPYCGVQSQRGTMEAEREE